MAPPGGPGPGAPGPRPLGGAVYRSPGALPVQVAPGPERYTQSVPPELAGRFGALTGIDVAGIPVHRGPAVTAQARVYQARAFTKGGEIFLPDEAGPLDDSGTRGLLAHELTHVVQQRLLSPSLPDEGSPDGQELEREASQAERWYRSGGSPPPRLAHLPVALLLAAHAGHPGSPSQAQQSWTAGDSLPPQFAEWLNTAREPAAGTQRQPGEPAPAPAPAPATQTLTLAPPIDAPIDFVPAQQPMVIEAPTQAPVQAERAEQLGELIANAERLAELCAERPANLDDPVSLDELSTKVYQRLRGMLRAELLVDRERAGLLADIS